MRRNLLSVLAVAVALATGGSVHADDGVFANFEATFLRLHQSGGVQQASTEGNYDFQFAPRIEAGYAYDRTGIRFRYWDYEDSEILVGAPLRASNIETYVLDLELFYTVDLSSRTSLEVSGGVRYNSLDQVHSLLPGPFVFYDLGYDALGATVGLEAQHRMRIGSFYARGRMSIVTGDYSIRLIGDRPVPFNGEVQDTTVYQTEVGIGTELAHTFACGLTVTGKLGLEYQQWADALFVENQWGIGNNLNMADAGFAGVVAGLGFSY